MLKREELANPNSCINKADDDEPVFVLRGQDKLAPVLVDLWAELALLNGCTNSAKIDEACTLAELMRNWHTKKFPD